MIGFLTQNTYLLTATLSEQGEEIPITPNDEFFKEAIDHFEIEAETYRLKIVGNVYNPQSLSLDEIKSLPTTSEIVRLTRDQVNSNQNCKNEITKGLNLTNSQTYKFYTVFHFSQHGGGPSLKR